MYYKPILRGDVFYCDLNSFPSHCLYKVRPVLVISNDKNNVYSDVILVVPISGSTRNKNLLPTHYLIPPSNNDLGLSLVHCEQILPVSKSMLRDYICSLPLYHMCAINDCLKIAIGLE